MQMFNLGVIVGVIVGIVIGGLAAYVYLNVTKK
jgi:uncharacterized membrane-anchored protein YhcB (DUF1043 family)